MVETIADILHHQFSGANGQRWREAYGAFCSGHSKAISVFKDLMKSDRRFQQFVRQCSENPLLKKKGVPECILFVTTRITKYPLLIERYSKSALKDRPAELELLRQAHNFVKDIGNVKLFVNLTFSFSTLGGASKLFVYKQISLCS